MRPLTEEQQQAIEQLKQVAEARKKYDEAIQACVDQRISNVYMASVLGVTEAAIRMHRKRLAEKKHRERYGI